jgi:hypothetical protein
MKCPTCGAPLDLDQKDDVLRCTYCGTTAQRPATIESEAAGTDPLASVVKLVEDRNHDGIPDAFEGLLPGVKVSHRTVVQSVSTTYSVDGRTYESLDQMPPDVRRRFERGNSPTFSVGNRVTFSVAGRLSFQKALDSVRPMARAPMSRVALVLALAIGFVLLIGLALAARTG